MIRKRIGNDIQLSWALYNEYGYPFNLDPDYLDYLNVEIRLPKMQKRYKPSFMRVQNNIVHLEFNAGSQEHPGVYDLFLSCKKDDGYNQHDLSTYTTDMCEAFELVNKACSDVLLEEDWYGIQSIVTYFNYDMLTNSQKDDMAERVASFVDYAEPRYRVKLFAPEIEWDLDWVKIQAETPLAGTRVLPVRLVVSTGYGLVDCPAIVNYPKEIYTGANHFRLKDKNNIINKETPFEYILFEYNLVNDVEDRRNYDFVQHWNFGDNVILEESVPTPQNPNNVWHGERGRNTFNTIYPEFAGRHYMTLDPDFIPQGSIPDVDEAEVCSNYEANMLIRPYSSSSSTPLPITESRYLNPEIIKVIAHGGNENKRVDVTSDEDTFLINTVCVGAMVNEEYEESRFNTSYGFGLEFYENTSASIWDALYPDSVFLSPIPFDFLVKNGGKEVYLNNENFIVTSYKGLEPGDGIRVISSTGVEHVAIVESAVVRTITLVDPLIGFVEDEVVTVKSYMPIGSMWNPSARYDEKGSQSFASNIVATKLRMIKDVTGVSWGVCRHAARMTASLSTFNASTGKWQTNWNERRGFGAIDVNRAIAYILTNKSNPRFRGSNAVNLPKTTNLLRFEDYTDNSYTAIKYLKRLFGFLQELMEVNENILLDTEIGSDGIFVEMPDKFKKFWPIYRAVGVGSWRAGVIYRAWPIVPGEQYTLSAYMRINTALPAITPMPNLRVVQSSTTGPTTESTAFATKLNTWELVVLPFTIVRNKSMQMQVVQSLPEGSTVEVACINMCRGLDNNPVYFPTIETIMNNG